MNRFLHHAALAAGLLAVGWVGAGYIPGNPLALALVGLIAAFYLMGAWELHHFHQATGSLSKAVAAASAPPESLPAWLATLHPSLHQAVRLRVEGERVALPAPAMTPYLSGLLVLLGMLGTFLGMVVTLKGTGLALETATDVEAIRASLSAPVRGLGLAFGTSVAGVAASAMLGLMSALTRRERLRTAQQLDAAIATTLRGFTQAHQREESLKLLKAQSDTLPALVTQLQGLVAQVERQGQALQDRLVDGQAQFHTEARQAYTGLAESVDRTLKTSLIDSARLAGAALEPAVRATMAGLAQEAATLRDALGAAARQQLDGMTARLDDTTTRLAGHWQAAMAEQQRQGEALTQGLHASLDHFSRTFDERATGLVDGVARRMDENAGTWAASWDQALARQQDSHDTLARHVQAAAATWQATLAEQQRQAEATTQGLHTALDDFSRAFDERATALVDGVARRMDENAGTWAASWDQALARQQDAHDTLARHAQAASTATVAGFEQHATALLRGVAEAQAAWETAAAERERTRLASFHDGLATMTTTLQRQAEADGQAVAERQQQICATLERTAGAITAQAEAHARATIDEISRLVQAASEAPRAAAEVVGELRQALSDSFVRDNAALDERNRLLSTLGDLLDAVNHAGTAQRAAIDALVSGTTDVLDRVGARFAETVEAESRSLQAVATQVTGSAAEVASLGEGFGTAVGLFSRASEDLMAQLQRIEAALGHAATRSDEQLAYYVAQAREIVDLTLGSQKQIVDDLQQLAPTRAAAEADAA